MPEEANAFQKNMLTDKQNSNGIAKNMTTLGGIHLIILREGSGVFSALEEQNGQSNPSKG